MRRRRTACVSTALAGLLIGLAGVTSPPAFAECDGPFPEFAEVVRTAPRIVIGDVVRVRPGGAWPGGAGELASRFTLQISHVVRGEPIAFLDVDDLVTSPCASVVGVHLGDRVALAIGGTAFTPAMKANMVAWIDEIPPEGFGPGGMSEAATMSLDEVFALVGQPVPSETASAAPAAAGPATFDPTDPTAPPTEAPWLAIVASLVAVAAVAVTAIEIRRRRT